MFFDMLAQIIKKKPHFSIPQGSERYSQLIFIIPYSVYRSPYIN